jgi:acetyltransferase-like isoleucine patch superfamily enzyme
MPWLEPRTLPAASQAAFDLYLERLNVQLADPNTDRNVLCRETLAQFLHAKSYGDLETSAPILALNLDPRNVTLEAEYYAATDPERFARVKPLLWLWYNFDLSPAAHNVSFGPAFRRVLAGHVFKRVGQNFKTFPGVQFSVGYNLVVGDDVTVHRNVLIDDIGGVTLHDHVSISDYANVYSHTHDALESGDVTLKHTTIGRGVRVTYHATVLAGTTLSDDSMVGTMSVVTRDVEPHTISVGIPARPTRRKIRPAGDLAVDSGRDQRPDDRKGNPDFPEFLEPGQGTMTVSNTRESVPGTQTESLENRR